MNRVPIFLPAFLTGVLLTGQTLVGAQNSLGGSITARPLVTQSIDSSHLVTLQGHVRRDLTPDRDLGPVEDALPMRLYLVLKRSPEQQADLDHLIARQQQPTAAEYHKWLTPQQFGERFGVSQQDIAKISAWLEAQGLQVHGVLNNATMIDVTATAGQVRDTFHTQIHYWNVREGKHAANAQDPSIPAALANVVVGIKGLSKIPTPSKHTPIQSFSYDTQTHRFHHVETDTASGIEPKYTDGQGDYLLTPQDFYTIYDARKIYNTGNLGAGATISLPEPTDMHYGTVNSSTGQASGGDMVTFRTLFGIGGTLNMKVMHGAGTVTCNDPGIDLDSEGEANLDAEWANAVAPSAQLIFMSCDANSSIGDGFTTALTALIDNNISDVISSSYGSSEAVITAADFAMDDMLASQAAVQGQTFIDAAGDAGSADADQNTATTAAKGLNIDQYAGHPLITATGGTDFSDKYDADQGGPPQSTYWGATNSQFYADALSYIPETPWNSSCADSIIAKDNGNYSGAGYCAALGAGADGTVVGGGGGFSAHYGQPAYQTGIPGLSAAATKRATPDISLFAANGFWGHFLVVCDSSNAATACTPPHTFGGSGGTSFTAPQTAGITALLVTYTGERQGTLNPALYALAKTQYTAKATATACYSNGQTNNVGVTTGLPAANCIFHDITTGNNDEPCQAGSLDCFVNSGAQYGMLSTTGSSSLTVAFPAGPEYDEATGLGSIDIYNLITNWNAAFASTTTLKATPTSISSSQSTTLTATVTGGTPPDYEGTPPALTGSVNFAVGITPLGACALNGGTCSLPVIGSTLQAGDNSITATFSGSGTYPPSTSTAITVDVTSLLPQTITFAQLLNVTYGVAPITLKATASSGLPVSFTVSGPATLNGSILTITGAGAVIVTALQAGNGNYAPAPSVPQTFNVGKALLTVTANNASRSYGAANPPFTYKITGFVNTDTSAVVSGTATETTTATGTSPAGTYPISFSTENLTATNYMFSYVNGTLTISGGPLTITTAALNYGVVGTAYSQTLTATGGTVPYTWQLIAGRLPLGLTLNSATGLISGTPTTAESGSILTFQLTDSSNSPQKATASFNIVISTTPTSLQITTSSLNNGVVGVPYSQTLSAIGGTGPYTWHLISGTLPALLTLNVSTGVIAGTPTVAIAATPLTIKVTDSSTPAQSATATFALTITTQTTTPLTITTTALNYGVAGTAYSQTLAATGGAGPYTWQLTAGRLPSGLTLNPATGLISGTPTSPVPGSILTFQVTDTSIPPQKATASFVLTIGSTE
jgi:pro-kumamolisin-like protein/MBG domain-containing protein/Big-like domain-containing protein/putative Ig domain-containing protein